MERMELEIKTEERDTAGLELGETRQGSLPEKPCVKEEPDEGSATNWDAQLQDFLRTLQAPHCSGEPTPLPGPHSSPGAREVATQTAAVATKWPKGLWVSSDLVSFVGEAKQDPEKPLDANDEEEGKGKEEGALEGDPVWPEVQRQRFRSLGYREADGPRELCRQLQEHCRQWLKPERRTKEQMVELVTLEQFLAILPLEMQGWVRKEAPKTCAQAVSLAEEFLLSQQKARGCEQKITGVLKETSVDLLASDQAVPDTVETRFSLNAAPLGSEHRNIFGPRLPACLPVNPGEGFLCLWAPLLWESEHPKRRRRSRGPRGKKPLSDSRTPDVPAHLVAQGVVVPPAVSGNLGAPLGPDLLPPVGLQMEVDEERFGASDKEPLLFAEGSDAFGAPHPGPCNFPPSQAFLYSSDPQPLLSPDTGMLPPYPCSLGSAPWPSPDGSALPLHGPPSWAGGDPGHVALQLAPLSAERARRPLWKHFSNVADNPCVARCNLCSVVVRRGSDPRHLSSTTLRNHLQRHHPAVLPPGGPGSASGERRRAPPPPRRGRDRGSLLGKRAAARLAAGEPIAPAPPRQGGPAEVPESLSKRLKGEMQETGTRLVAEMIALLGLPLATVEAAAFRRMLHFFAPWYIPPSRRTISRRILPSIYESMRELVRAQLSETHGRKVHFVADVWSSGHHRYLSLTAHWWQPEDLKAAEATDPRLAVPSEPPVLPPGYRAALLQVRNVEAKASRKQIADEFLAALEEWAPRGHVLRGHMVTDASRNMLAVLNAAGFEGIVCVAHQLHLVVQDAVGLGNKVNPKWEPGTQATRALLDTCRYLVGRFSRSLNMARWLRERQEELGQEDQALLQDLPTRWNSTYTMVSRLVEQRAVLEDVASAAPAQPGEKPAGLSAAEWLALSEMVEVLKPFKETNDVLCAHAAGLGQVIPLVRALDRALEAMLGRESPLLPQSRGLVFRLRAGVRKRLHPLCRDRVYRLACLCDPRLKATLALQGAEREEWRAELLAEVQRVPGERCGGGDQGPALGREEQEDEGEQGPCAEPLDEEEEEEEESLSSSSPGRGSTPQYWSSVVSWAVAAAGEAARGAEEDAAEVMVREYLAEPTQPPESDPLQYWVRKSSLWPELSRLAMDLLSCPPTSVQSERVFSHLSDLLRPHRSRLDPVMVERLAFIKANSPLLGFPALDLPS